MKISARQTTVLGAVLLGLLALIPLAAVAQVEEARAAIEGMV